MASITFCKSDGAGDESSGQPHDPLGPPVTPTHLPLPDALDPLPEGTLEPRAQLEGIAPDLDDVVHQGAHGSQGKGGGEEHHVAELDEHLLVVLEGVLGRKRRRKNMLQWGWWRLHYTPPGPCPSGAAHLILLHAAFHLCLRQLRGVVLLRWVNP